MGKLSGKFALITGGNSGIGLATAKLFAQEGAKVAITGRNQQSLDEAIKILGPEHLAIQSDAQDLTAMDKAFSQIKEQFGALDILFANAGTGISPAIEQIKEEDFDRIFDTNVKGVFFTFQKALPLLRPGSSVILNASIAAGIGRTGMVLYGSSKAAVRSLARGLSAEFITSGIRVNSISPGPIDTPIFYRGGRPQAVADAHRDALKANIPLGRLGTAEEVAQAVLFLASDDSRFIIGTDLTVDGGVTEVRAARPRL